jgi:hypothetical protein
MKRCIALLTGLLVLGCDGSTQPSSLYRSYFLTAVDEHALPVPYGGDGTLLLASGLSFGGADRPHEQGPSQGMVSYTLLVRRPDHTEEHSTIELNYTIQDGTLSINLCPPLALCITSTVLAGPLSDSHSELVLTHYLAGHPTSVYRYFPALPD